MKIIINKFTLAIFNIWNNIIQPFITVFFTNKLLPWLLSFLKEDPDLKSVIITIINISVTAFILVVTLSIGPFEKISNSLSGRMYEYFLKNKKFSKPIFINLCLCLGQIILFPFISYCNLIVIIYLICLSIILWNIYKYSISIKAQLDLTSTCYPIIEEELQEEIKKFQQLEKEIKQNPLYSIEDNKKLIFDSVLLGLDTNNYPLGNPYNGYDKIFIYKIHQVFDLVISNMDSLKYSAYEMSIESLFRSFNLYLDYLNNHSISFDNVLLDFLDISKAVLNKSRKNSNKLYSDIYIGKLNQLIKKVSELNINKDYYYETIINFFGDFIIPFDKDDIVKGLTRFEYIGSLIFCQNVFLEFSYKKYISFIKYYQSLIYKTKDMSKVYINRVINSFAYETILNVTYLYNEEFFSCILNLLNSINTEYVLPIVNDFSTSVSVLGKDKSIYSIIRLLILDQKLETDDGKKNLYKLRKIKSLIEVLKRRYNGKGTQLNGIITLLYNIYFDIYTLFDDYIFKLTQTDFNNWTISLLQQEKDEFLTILENILFFTINNNRGKYDDIIFSEFKLFLIVLNKNRGNNAVKNYIIKNKKKLIKTIVLSNNLSEKVKIEMYRIIKTVLPTEYKKYLSKKIKRFVREINKTNKSYGFTVEECYDKKTFEIAPFFINLHIKKFIRDYINDVIFIYYLYKIKKLKNNVLKMPYPLDINMIIREQHISKLLVQCLIQEMCEEGHLYLENNIIYKFE